MMHPVMIFAFLLLTTLYCSFTVPACGQQTDEESAITHLRSTGVEFDSRNGKIVGVNFSRSTASDSDARYLASISSLQEIDFGQREFTDKAMEYIAELETVRSINLSLCPITNAGLAKLCTNRNLESLDLTGTDITDLGPLTHLLKLKHLELQHCAIDDSQTEHLATIESLVELNLSSTEVTDVGVTTLTRLQKLESLYLADARITDCGALRLADCPRLKWLYLAYSIGNGYKPRRCNVSAIALRELKQKLPGLHVYGRPSRPITCEVGFMENNRHVVKQMGILDLIGVSDKSRVQSIDLSDTIVDDESLASIGQFTKLKSLKLARTWITDETLERIGDLRQLETLDMRDTRVTDVGVAHLAICKSLARLNLHNTMTSGIAFKDLVVLKKLVDVDISRNKGDTRWSGRLELSPGLSDDGLHAISRLEWLTRLNLECFDFNPAVSADGIRCLFKMTQLKALGIYGLPIDEELMKELKRNLPDTKLDYKTSYGLFD